MKDFITAALPWIIIGIAIALLAVNAGKRKQGEKKPMTIRRVLVKQLNRPMVTIIGRFNCYALARKRPRLPCAKGAVSEAD